MNLGLPVLDAKGRRGVVVKNVKFINNKGAYLSDNQTYQSKAGKAPRIIIRLAAKDKSAKSLAKAANKVLRNSEAMQFEIEPLDVQSIINGDSLYSGYSVTVKNAKVKVSIPKYKNGSALIGKTSKKTLRLSSDYTVNSDGTYNFMKNFKGTNITIK